ncbi:hypothetical protein [Conchiformibius steedae]|uniref:hypothetical protein n=1 Tax=Conchiformibius steedae TaxID=153493 RepID=UPI0026EA9C86|nr:hypothetical protein [Conchiformibius steedae]
MIKKIFSSLMLASVLLTGACGDAAEADTPTKKSAAKSAPAPRRNLLEDTALLQSAQNSLPQQPQFAGKPVYIYEKIDFFNGVRPRIELLAQDPQHPDKLLFFRYEHGKWQLVENEDEEFATKKKPERHLMPLAQIRFQDVPTIAQMWRQHAKHTQAVIREPYHIAFVLLPKTQQRFWHTAELEAHGAQYYLSVFPDFSIFEFKKL